MTDNEYEAFIDLLTAHAFCFPKPLNLEYAGPQYFDHLRRFDLEVVEQALWMALDTCRDFPTIAELLEPAKAIRHARSDAERAQERECKRLGYEAEALASDVQPPEGQTKAAEILEMLGDHTRMDVITNPEPHARPRVPHAAYRTPTVDHAERKRRLLNQLAQVRREEEERTASTEAAPVIHLRA